MFTKLMLALCMAFAAEKAEMMPVFIVTSDVVTYIVDAKDEEKKKLGRCLSNVSPDFNNILSVLDMPRGSVTEFNVPVDTIFGMFNTKSSKWNEPPTQPYLFKSRTNAKCNLGFWQSVNLSSRIVTGKTSEFIVTECVSLNNKVRYWQVCPINSNIKIKQCFEQATKRLTSKFHINATLDAKIEVFVCICKNTMYKPTAAK